MQIQFNFIKCQLCNVSTCWLYWPSPCPETDLTAQHIYAPSKHFEIVTSAKIDTQNFQNIKYT